MVEQQNSWLEDYVLHTLPDVIKAGIDEAVAPLRMAIEALSAELEEAVKKAGELETQIDNLDDNTPHRDHYHENYASADHVERSENSFRNQLSNLRNDLESLGYRVNDVERKASNAQSAADDARRTARGGW